jgi:hypothetical protein
MGRMPMPRGTAATLFSRLDQERQDGQCPKQRATLDPAAMMAFTGRHEIPGDALSIRGRLGRELP